MRIFLQPIDHNEFEDSKQPLTTRLILSWLNNRFFNEQASTAARIGRLLAVLTLTYCLVGTVVFYSFRFSLAGSEFKLLLPLLLFVITPLMVIASVMAFFVGYSMQQKQQLTLVNELRSKPVALNDEQALAAASSNIRHKISIDLHDSTIQHYIGLMLGLKALRRKIPQGEAIAAEVDELVNMTAESIVELRQYVGDLKPRLEKPLLPAILDVAKKYQFRHGIAVAVNADPELRVSDCLAIEVYQLVREGLSNIHRHTAAKQAEINLYYQLDKLVIEFINQVDNAQDSIHFKPRSITERVNHLGGKVSVNHRADDKTAEVKTIVTAEIPLQAMDKRYVAFD